MKNNNSTILKTVVGALCLCTLFFSCGKQTPPSIEVEAFLVMKSLDIKKLGDLKVYVISDPYPMFNEIKTSNIARYEKARIGIAKTNSIIKALESKIIDIRNQADRLVIEKQKTIEGIDKMVDERLDVARSTVRDANLEITNIEMELESDATNTALIEFNELQEARQKIEKSYEPQIDNAVDEVSEAEKALNEYISRSLAQAAKLINDHIIASNLSVDLVPKDGRFDSAYSYDDYGVKYNNEIFEVEESYSLGGGEDRYFVADVTPRVTDYVKRYLVFKKIPAGIQSPAIRQSFLNMFVIYKEHRTGLEATLTIAREKISSLRKEQYLAAQKFDFQNSDKMASLESEVSSLKSRWLSRRNRIKALKEQILEEDSILKRTREEQVADLRSEIEKKYFDQRTANEEEIASLEAKRSSSIAEALEEERKKIMREGVDKITAGIASKIIETGTTDGDGKLVVKVPNSGDFFVLAQTRTGADEDLLWFEKVGITDGEITTVKLSNSNAKRATGLGELVFGDWQIF